MTTTLTAAQVTSKDLEQVATLAAELPQGSALGVMMQHLVASVRAGRDVTLLKDEEQLSPQDAADLLRMSRPHLLKFMDGGELSFYRVGNRRRIRMEDLLDFVARRELARETVANAFGNPDLVEQALRESAAELTDGDLVELDAV